jgi:hypothetical protein
MKHPKTAKEVKRFTKREIMKLPLKFTTFHFMLICMGYGLLGNPKVFRMDDPSNGDIVFYERI